MTVLEDLGYVEHIGPPSSKHLDDQQKAERLCKTANTIDLKGNKKKIQVLKKNTRVNDPVLINGKHLEDVEEFPFFGTKVATTGDCDKKITTRIGKANQVFAMLMPVW